MVKYWLGMVKNWPPDRSILVRKCRLKSLESLFEGFSLIT
jgi:hypothetical protein